ncbi:toxic cation resistance protein [Streptomyces mangrovisoli]|uniref:Toxic cation resistance protein n=1 Tax=Streptomyces mangrovisoli TaxID=1428628 RepID=A0A1J4NQS7_9ACTN|nr:toxic cation resistance protein [Streptomyces mangrovisoli]
MSLDKVQEAAPGLVDLYKAAQVSLAKNRITGQRAAVYLVLDHSASMRRFYRDGTMQHLAEQALGLSANLDDDGVVPLVFFSGGVDRVADIGLDNHQGRVDALHRSLGWGGTRFAPAMHAVIDHYRAAGTADPAFVIFQTDGEPFDRKETRELLRQCSSLPIFWQFVGFGSNWALRFLRTLDDLTGRTVDNAGFFAAGQSPAKRGDAALYDLLMKEFPTWLTAARAAGVLRQGPG